MALNLLPITQALQSHALASGWFDRVDGHEPKNAPGKGLSAAVWLQKLDAVPARSGLAVSSARVEMSIRVSTPMLTDPEDAIDPELLSAVDALLTAYSSDFQLGGLITAVDLLGAYGTPLGARAGYLTQDQTPYRVMTITLPLILDDQWTQAP